MAQGVRLTWWSPPPVEGQTLPAGQVVGAERDDAPIGADGMDAAVSQPVQIEGPRILEGHAGDGKGVGLGAGEDNVPLAQARPLSGRVRTAGGRRYSRPGWDQ